MDFQKNPITIVTKVTVVKYTVLNVKGDAMKKFSTQKERIRSSLMENVSLWQGRKK